jgi:hypothetical protein
MSVWSECISSAIPNTLVISNVLIETTPQFNSQKNLVTIEVKNIVQEIEVMDVKALITEFLQRKLTNNLLTIEVKVNSQTASVEKTYITNEELFTEWANENQALYELKKQLNLELL